MSSDGAGGGAGGPAPAQHRHATTSHGFDLPVMPEAVDIFDTTLRDGSQ
jgi:hypothetical protein